MMSTEHGTYGSMVLDSLDTKRSLLLSLSLSLTFVSVEVEWIDMVKDTEALWGSDMIL